MWKKIKFEKDEEKNNNGYCQKMDTIFIGISTWAL